MEQSKPAPAEVTPEVKVEGTPEAKPQVETKPEVKPETIGDVLDGKKKEETVPLAAFLELKNENKDTKKALTDLQRKIELGASKEEVADDIKSIGEEFGVDPKFLNKLATAIRKEADKDADEKLQKTLGPIAERERSAKIDKIFSEHFDKAMTDMPEYADIVNRDVIKALSLDPKNQNKTFAQLIDETYGKALPPGKRTLEPTVARGGKAPESIDYDRAARDPSYYNEIMSNPDTKKEYNENLTDRLSSSL